MKSLEISSMLLMIQRGYSIYSMNNETINQMINLGLIEYSNNEFTITEIGQLYLEKVYAEKSLLLFRYLSGNSELFDTSLANSLSKKTL